MVSWAGKSAFTELLPTLATSTKQLKKLSGGFDLEKEFSSAADVRQAAASLGALSSLTSLTHIKLCIESAELDGGPAPLLSGLGSLSSLSSCELCISGSGPRFMRWGAVGLEHLPAHLTSLRLGVRLGLHSNDVEEFIGEAGVGELQCMLEEGGEGTGIDTPGNMFGTYPSKDQPPMSLGHLTALKELRPVPGGPFMCDLCIRAGDVLPPNLTALELDEDCRNLGGLLTGPLAAPTVRPLLSLTSLQELTIHYSKASAQDLKHLSSALAAPKGALTAVSLGYQTLAAAAATAGGWPSLPMVGLRLSTVDVQIYDAKPSDEQAASAILSAVSQLTGLTALSIGAQGHLAATPQQLAGALAGLTNLKEFKLESSTKADKPDGKHSAAGVEALSKQLAGLPNLVHLTVREVGGGRSPGLPVSAAIIDAGANRQQLTHLQIGR